ncbi:MAG TPA: RDD family protein [Mycobacteriales bacterium]|nr:RDD family protein [Mycobacteriales bacterium]
MTARPETGPGAVAGVGVRLAAFVVDSVIAIVIAIVSTGPPPGSTYNLVVYGAFLAIELVFVTVAGQTPGMRVAGLAVMSAADASKPRLRWVAVRTLLLAAVVPALITDSSGRAMHDRAAGTVTVRTR